MSGLPTKAVVEINKTANRYRSSIVIKIDDRHIDVKSILGLSITLLADRQYVLDIHGPDEAEAKKAMIDIFNRHDLSATV